MGARGYRTQKAAAAEARGKAREQLADQRDTPSIIRRCAHHKKRQSTVWGLFGKARGKHLCDACHNYLISLRDEKFLKALEASESKAEEAIDKALKEVA